MLKWLVLLNVPIPEDFEKEAEIWLDAKVGELMRQLPNFTYHQLLCLMSYEAKHKRRSYVMRKLHTRYCRLQKSQEWEAMERWVR